ncbi:MAG: aspartate-semialdehyde dehydrogenase [Candidatus Omnitrophota bacterium]
MKKYNLAVIGVGAVGVEMLRVLKQRNFPIGELCVFARSAREINVDGEKYNVEAISPDGFKGMDIALFAGTEGEKGAAVVYAEEAVKRGAVVVDNGADFRMDPKVPLVVPEVNAQDVNIIKNWFLVKKHRPEGGVLAPDSKSHKGIIANPNCSTIQMVAALWPIYKQVGIKRIVVTTLQAASGAGRGAVEQLRQELIDLSKTEFQSVRVSKCQGDALPQQLAFNVFPHLGSFMEEDYTSEEWKLVRESHKIMHDDKINISATTIRVPVRTGHCESIYIETGKLIEPEKVKEILSEVPGIIVVDSPKNKLYPMPFDAEGRDEIFVGRIRRDPFVQCGLWLWVVADNLRKGAATNAIQIAEVLINGS